MTNKATKRPLRLTRRGQRVKTLAQGVSALAIFYGAIYALALLSKYWLNH